MNTSGYCQISINNKQVGLLFGLPAIAQIGEKAVTIDFYTATAIDGQPAQTYSLYGLQHIMYAGYCNNCNADGVPVALTARDFYNFVEECASEPDKAALVLKPVIECFENSRYVKPLVSVDPSPNKSKKKS